MPSIRRNGGRGGSEGRRGVSGHAGSRGRRRRRFALGQQKRTADGQTPRPRFQASNGGRSETIHHNLHCPPLMCLAQQDEQNRVASGSCTVWDFASAWPSRVARGKHGKQKVRAVRESGTAVRACAWARICTVKIQDTAGTRTFARRRAHTHARKQAPTTHRTARTRAEGVRKTARS